MYQAAFVYHDVLADHVLRDDHPLRPHRLRLTHDLLQGYGAFETDGALLVEHRPATKEELTAVHSPEYVNAVERIGKGDPTVNPAAFNFSYDGDNPSYPGIYEAAVNSTGASLVAAELVLEGKARTAFNASGGLHHAARHHASGFCVFNDPAVVIAYLLQHVRRVAYVDIDAHHGDGVQNAFYGSNEVLTISTHESGRYLFPGTGAVDEIGEGSSRGYAINLPLLPYTGDAVYQWAFNEIVPPLLTAFRPEVVVLQLGVDAHANDPLAHLQLTTKTYEQVLPQLLAGAPRVVALGGGGYDMSAVMRVWALEYGVMLGVAWPNALPPACAEQHGIAHLRDATAPELPPGALERSLEFAEQQVEALKRTVFPIHGL